MVKKKRVIAISGESQHEVDEVCTFQVHPRKRTDGRLKSTKSKSITVENISLHDGLKIVRLGVDLFMMQKTRAIAG